MVVTAAVVVTVVAVGAATSREAQPVCVRRRWRAVPWHTRVMSRWRWRLRRPDSVSPATRTRTRTHTRIGTRTHAHTRLLAVRRRRRNSNGM